MFLLNAWGTLTPAWVKQEPQGNIKQVPHGFRARVHAKHALKEPLLWKNVVQRGLCSTGWRSPPACGSGQPSSSLRCVSGAGRSHAVPEGFGLASPRTRQLQGPHSAVNAKDRWQPPAQPSPFLALSFPLNAHWTSFPTHQTQPMCIHLRRTNNLKWRCSLAVTITLSIYSAETNDESRAALQIRKNLKIFWFLLPKLFSQQGLSSRKWPDPKVFVPVTRCDSRQSSSIVLDIVWCVGLREERWKQTRDADKNFFLCYSNKKYIHTEI